MNLQGVITRIVRRVQCKNEDEMLAFAARVAPVLVTGDVIALTGGLGAGKTTFVRGVIQSQLECEEVPSPTYTLVQTYNLPNYELWHCDLYRLKQPDEIYEIGLLEAFDDAVCFIEWPDKMGNYLPEDALCIDISFKGEGRVLTLNALWDDKLTADDNV